MIEDFNIISSETISGRKHKITMIITTRPTSTSDYQDFFNKLALSFCIKYKCKFAGNLDVALNHFNDSSILVFEVKEYKHPERRRLTVRGWEKD